MKPSSLLFCLLSFVFLLIACSTGDKQNNIQFVDVFQRNDGVYPEYRIPALIVSRDGTLLAFAEGRQRLNDHAQNDIVLKRSKDNGETWSETKTIYEDGANVAVNPTAVLLPSGRILLMFQHFPAGYHSRPSKKENIKLLHTGVEGGFISKTLVMFSDDDGNTWSKPRDVTAGTKRPVGVNSTASGPGVGIVLTRGEPNGRIIVPTNEGSWEHNLHKFNVYACYSDDGGQIWQFGETAPNDDNGYGNEVQMVELADGSILLNSRSIYGTKHRKLAVSRDGGETWSSLHDQLDLPEPQCMGSTIRYAWPEEGGSILLYSGPASQNSREQGTIFISHDEGETWPQRLLVYPGKFAYSCLAKLPDGSLGLLFEADGYETIKFVRLAAELIDHS